MTRTGWKWIAASVLCVCASSGAWAQERPDHRPTLSIIEFDTDRTGWVPPPQLGATLADVLADGLVASGEYRVLDREFLGSTADRGHKASVAALRVAAQHAEVNYLVIGSVTRFSTEQRGHSGGAIIPIIPHLVGLPLLAGLHRNDTDSVLGLSVRVIDVASGEIVATATAQGRATRRQVSLGGLSFFPHAIGAAGYSSSVQGAREALVDEALHQAVAEAGRELIAAAPRLARVAMPRETDAP